MCHPKTWAGCTWKKFWSVMWSKNIYYLDCPLGQVVWRQLNLENLELKYRKYRERIEKRVGHMIWIESLRTCGVRFGLCHILENKLIRQFQNLESKHHDQSNGNQQKLLFQVVMHHWLNLEEHLYSKHLLKLHFTKTTKKLVSTNRATFQAEKISDHKKVFENFPELCALWMHLLQALLNRLRQTVFRNSTANTLFWADFNFGPYIVPWASRGHKIRKKFRRLFLRSLIV